MRPPSGLIAMLMVGEFFGHVGFGTTPLAQWLASVKDRTTLTVKWNMTKLPLPTSTEISLVSSILSELSGWADPLPLLGKRRR